jgi:hypothetical protein
MTSQRPPRSTLDGLPIVSIGAVLMAGGPSFGGSPAADDDGDKPSEIERAPFTAEPGRHTPRRQAARPVVPSSRSRFGHF